MLLKVRTYKVFVAFSLLAFICISTFTKDLHEILVEHQHVACYDQPNDSFKHYHSTDHEKHDCKISQFVLAPLIAIDPYHLDLEIVFGFYDEPYFYKSFIWDFHYTSTLSRGPPNLVS